MFADPELDPEDPLDTHDLRYLIGLTLIAWAMLISLGIQAHLS